MSFAFFLRNNLNSLPYDLGKLVAKVPYSYRPGIGTSYRKARKEILEFKTSSKNQNQQYIFEQLKKITTYAYNEIPFYRSYYDEKNFHPDQLNSFQDIPLIPIINKDLLLEWSIEERSNLKLESMKVNTGGSSGKPLSLYTPPSKMGIEWAHLHYIWKKQFNFKPSDLKLMLVGRSDMKDFVEYDFVRHSLKIDIYTSFETVSVKLLKKYGNRPILFLHGYPSAIYEFALYCKTDKKLLGKIKKDLKGCILNSEFPFKYQRNIIEKTFCIKTAAFYGHTEGCVIAFEESKYNYSPLHSYGYTESVSIDNQVHLIGTNYYNYVSPLIRYDTEDIVAKPEYNKGLLSSFLIENGRQGEFILDKQNKKISLTGLIFGRHHPLFDFCTHIQVKQNNPGKARILFVERKKSVINPSELFDSKNVEVDFSFEKIEEPIRTPAGKIKLLV